MPKILKRIMKSFDAVPYSFLPTEELDVGERRREEEPAPPPEPEAERPPEPKAEREPERGTPERQPELEFPGSPIDFAQIQAQAILADARQEAEKYKEEARLALEQEQEEVRKKAREEGYSQGFAQGMADAMQEAKLQREQMAVQQTREVKEFLEQAARERDRIFDDSREELKDLAVAIAEKVIRVSLRGCGDILRRMVEAATDKHKRCEWAHIYVADCDVRGSASTIPELTAALRHISSRVRVTPMADDESGTCIVEMPDVILDASVSTQLGNIREVLSNTPPEQDEE